ncbi:hypothetical protein VTN02DRAFT_4252 [Thermoascus thermophilus]
MLTEKQLSAEGSSRANNRCGQAEREEQLRGNGSWMIMETRNLDNQQRDLSESGRITDSESTRHGSVENRSFRSLTSAVVGLQVPVARELSPEANNN